MLSLKLPQLLRVHQVPRVRGCTLQLLPSGPDWGWGSLSNRGRPPCRLMVPPIPGSLFLCSLRSRLATRSLGRRAPSEPPSPKGARRLCQLRLPSCVGPSSALWVLGPGLRWQSDVVWLWGHCDLQPTVLNPASPALVEREGPAQ